MTTEVRLRYCGKRGRFDAVDDARGDALRAMAKALTVADCDPARAEQLLTDAATAPPDKFALLQKLVEAETGAGLPSAKPTGAAVTFRSVAEDWVSGKLAKDYPDHVRTKKTATADGERLDVLYPLIGDVPLSKFSLPDADRAMAALPPKAKASATRRHYAQVISKVLKLAVYPCRVIDRSPIPSGWLPKVRSSKARAFPHPKEDAALMAWTAIPLARRLVWGLLAREGLRLSEALALRWRDVASGAITLDGSKTNDPRAWAMSPGTADALKAFRPKASADDDPIRPTAQRGQEKGEVSQ